MTMYSILKFENESKLKEVIQQAMYYILKILPISTMTIKKKCVNSFSKYQYEDCEEVCDFPSENMMQLSFKKDWLPLKKAKFEDIEVNIHNNPDKILTRIYGNYMELPPEDKRFRPAPEKIDFGKY